MRFYCACSEDPQGLLDYCEPHRFFRCHVERWNVPAANRDDRECPPCWLARIRSVSLSSKATPTRGKR